MGSLTVRLLNVMSPPCTFSRGSFDTSVKRKSNYIIFQFFQSMVRLSVVIGPLTFKIDIATWSLFCSSEVRHESSSSKVSDMGLERFLKGHKINIDVVFMG